MNVESGRVFARGGFLQGGVFCKGGFLQGVVFCKAANIRSPPVVPIFLSVTPLVFFTTYGVEGKYFSIYGKRNLYIVIPLN
jgi:hypothetical protein